MGVYKETKYVSERDSLLFGRQVTCGNLLTLVVPFWVKWFVMDDCSLENIQAVCEFRHFTDESFVCVSDHLLGFVSLLKKVVVKTISDRISHSEHWTLIVTPHRKLSGNIRLRSYCEVLNRKSLSDFMLYFKNMRVPCTILFHNMACKYLVYLVKLLLGQICRWGTACLNCDFTNAAMATNSEHNKNSVSGACCTSNSWRAVLRRSIYSKYYTYSY